MEELALLSKFSVLSTEKQQEVLDFLEFLSQKEKKSQSKITTQKPLLFGELAGNFKIANDFNEPLEDFKDYM